VTNTWGVTNRFKEEMARLFSMSDLGPLHYYLGIEVHQGVNGITLCQSAYADKIIEKAGLKGCNPCSTPMEPRLKLSKVSSNPPVDATLYRSIVGRLRYLVHTRPDIAFAVAMVTGALSSIFSGTLQARALMAVSIDAVRVHWSSSATVMRIWPGIAMTGRVRLKLSSSSAKTQ
jgi:hypothetical protein